VTRGGAPYRHPPPPPQPPTRLTPCRDTASPRPGAPPLDPAGGRASRPPSFKDILHTHSPPLTPHPTPSYPPRPHAGPPPRATRIGASHHRARQSPRVRRHPNHKNWAPTERPRSHPLCSQSSAPAESSTASRPTPS
jgi:hypothetical protein